MNELFRRGAQFGDKAERAKFVRCDRIMMTREDFEDARMTCQIGIAALRPAEFVILRIDQLAANSTLR